MTARIASWAALLAIAVVATFAQLDRSARFEPQLAPLVPPAFSGFAAEQRAEAALTADDPSLALSEARALVARRPMPGRHLSLLSLAAAQAGDEELALTALEASTTRGWRVPLAQLASGRAAVLAGEHDIAAMRIAALLATGSLPEQAQGLLAELIATPQGREAMARRYAGRGSWQSGSIPAALSASNPGDASQMLALALEEGATLPCDRLALLAAEYARQGEEEAAARFWPRNCPSG